MPARESVSLEPCAVLDVWIMGKVCDGACCRPIMQKVHGRVYEGGDTVIAWHLPSDPLRGGVLNSQEAHTGERSRQMWQQWAEATE